METEEQGPLENLDLQLPGREAIGKGSDVFQKYQHPAKSWNHLITTSTTHSCHIAWPGNAFGSEAAGQAPGPGAAMESDVAKALRQAGFPEVESKASPETMTNKILSGIQKRILKIDENVTKLEPHTSMSLAGKIFVSILFSVLVALQFLADTHTHPN